ncbi:hypothetical protein T09_15111, partial [Trichinella sp. T9]
MKTYAENTLMYVTKKPKYRMEKNALNVIMEKDATVLVQTLSGQSGLQKVQLVVHTQENGIKS